MSITILSATYANRKHILEKTLLAWEKLDQVRDIILIDNGSSYSVREFVEKGAYTKTQTYTFRENMGSAGAYSKAMEMALENPQTEYCIILDDDNLITDETLEKLITHSKKLQERYPEKPAACLSVRMNMEIMLDDMSHQKTITPTIVSSAFCGIDLLTIIQKRFQKPDTNVYQHHEIPLLWGTYGGTFFHKKLIQQIGVPRPELFLYADDPEWSLRIFQAGGVIMLYTDCHITDIDDSWWVSRDASGKLIKKRANPLFQGSDFRVFYGIRGLVWLEKNFFQKNMLRYFLNQVCVVGGLSVFGIITLRWQRTFLIWKAIHHGKKGIFNNTLYRVESEKSA